MKFCSDCGASLNQDAKFCGGCGKALAAATPRPKSRWRILVWMLTGGVLGIIALIAGGIWLDAHQRAFWADYNASQKPVEISSLPPSDPDTPSDTAYDIRRFDVIQYDSGLSPGPEKTGRGAKPGP